MKNSSSINKYTIIITTYNRYEYLKRLLKFYNKYNNQFNILILDSSSDKIDNELSLLVKKKILIILNILHLLLYLIKLVMDLNLSKLHL